MLTFPSEKITVTKKCTFAFASPNPSVITL